MRTDDVALALIEARLATAREAQRGARIQQARRAGAPRRRRDERRQRSWLWWPRSPRPSRPAGPGVRVWTRTSAWHTLSAPGPPSGRADEGAGCSTGRVTTMSERPCGASDEGQSRRACPSRCSAGPTLQVDGADGYRFRSRKSWALLAFLLLTERAPTRSRLASLLFAEADDPLGALRWCLAEIRRGLGPGGLLDGDPVELVLPPGTVVDVDVLVHGHWRDAVDLPGLGAEFLDGPTIQNAEAFEAWLLSQRRRLAAAVESILHEAALGYLSRGDGSTAPASLAVRAAVMSPARREPPGPA